MQEGLIIEANEADFVDFNSHRDFKSEKEFADYLEINMRVFCIEDLGYELSFYKREFLVDLNTKVGRRGHAIDFFIKTVCGKNILIECKRPSSISSDMNKAIGQVLGYKTMFENNGVPIDLCVICSTLFSKIPYQTIQRNNLPIDLIIINKSKAIYVSRTR